MAKKNTTVLINGAGTVGNRDADVLLSLGIDVILCKYDGKIESPSDEIKVKELQALYKRHEDKKLRMYAARGSDLTDRINRLQKAGLNCVGSIDDLDLSTVDVVIDATNGRDERNYLELYKPNGVPFAINGGGLALLVKELYFASAPGTVVLERTEEYHQHNAQIVSCNTHCVTTALGILRNVLLEHGMDDGSENGDNESMVKFIDITYNRRHDDPHKGKSKPEFVNIEPRPYHMEELYFLLPQTRGKVHSTVSKWPTEYFHNVTIDVEFHDELTPIIVGAYKLALHDYPRAIFVEHGLGHERTMQAAQWAGIDDADLPFPIYMVKQVHETKLKIFGLTPQRGIVAPSTADYVLMRTQKMSWPQAFDIVNASATFRGHSFQHIANSVQDNLRYYKKMQEKYRKG